MTLLTQADSLCACSVRTNQLGPEDAKAFADALCVNTSLTECNVRDNKLDNESATALTKISAPKGIMLFGGKHGQKEAAFHDQRLRPVDAILIMQL